MTTRPKGQNLVYCCRWRHL